MRTVGAWGVALLCCLVSAATAKAAPEVSLTAKAAPLPGFPHTGNLLGAGARLSLDVTVRTPAPGARPPQLSHLAITLPEGITLHPSGFPVCQPSVLGPGGPGPTGCPKGSTAGGPGTAEALVPVASTTQPQTLTTQAFFAQGGLSLLASGAEPPGIEALGTVTPVHTTSGFALEIAPPQTESAAPAGALRYTGLSLSLGSAVKVGNRPIYLLTMPAKCSRGYLPFHLDATFTPDAGGPAETAESDYRAPCPRHRSPPAPVPPSLTLSARALPLAGFPHTGDLAGRGASLSLTVGFGGNQYGGFPPPLSALVLTLPPGTRFSSHGFPRCRTAPTVGTAPHCPAKTLIGPETSAETSVASASGVVVETAWVQSFYDRFGGMSFLTVGEAPADFSVTGTGVRATAGGAPQIRYALPLVETEPGQRYMSLTGLNLRLGSGLMTPNGPRFSLLLPRRCPLGYLPFAAEAAFAAVGGLPAQTASATYRAPCPRHSHPRSRGRHAKR
jgi:hypothetical protein